MSSFSAVTNFRASVSGRWGHFSYRFLDNSDIFDFHFSSEYFRRGMSIKCFRNLGIYFSNFVFSKFSNFYSFFFDFRYSKFFGRFTINSKLGLVNPFKIVKRINSFYNFKNPKKINFESGKDLKIIFLISFVKFKGNFSFSANRPSNNYFEVFKFFEGNYYSPVKLLICIKDIASTKSSFFQKSSIFSFPEFIDRIFSFKNPSASTRRIAKLTNFTKIKDSSDFVRVLYYPLPKKKNLRSSSWMFTSKLKVIFQELIKFFAGYYFRFDPIRFKSVVLNSEDFLTSEFDFSCSLDRWAFKIFYVRVIRNKFFCFLKNYAGVLKSFKYLGFEEKFHSVRELSDFSSIPASVISNVFKYRLKNRERVNPILRSLIRLLSFKENILGSVIAQNGRFTKRQRASHNVYRAGSVAFNSFLLPIDFSNSVSILKYSMVSIKVWIAHIPPIEFFTKFRSISSSLVFPSVLNNGFSVQYSNLFRVRNYFAYYKLFKLFYCKSSFKLGRFWNKAENFSFFPSIDFHYLKAYRKFSKFFTYSRRKYTKKILSAGGGFLQ